MIDELRVIGEVMDLYRIESVVDGWNVWYVIDGEEFGRHCATEEHVQELCQRIINYYCK